MAYGTLYLVVGPTGSGKQALIDTALEVRGDLRRAPLIIAPGRSDNRGVVGSIPADRFQHMRRQNAFILQWDADGIRYGLTHDAAKQLRDGQSLILAADAAMIPLAEREFKNVRTIYITARMDVLRRRLMAINFGTDRDIDMHLSQAGRVKPHGDEVIVVDTSDSIAEGARALVNAIVPAKAVAG